jgi:DNA-binding transcriptional regulator LsrR (DeoR family)
MSFHQSQDRHHPQSLANQTPDAPVTVHSGRAREIELPMNLRGRWVNVLITDRGTAERLMA